MFNSYDPDFPEEVDDFAPADPDPLAHARGLWLRARCGKLTASNVARARSFTAKGQPTADRVKLLQELCAERMTDVSVRHYVTPEMQWGLDHEDDARAAYEQRTGNDVTHTPYEFRDHPTIENCGASNDGLVSDVGMIEIKCPTTTKYVAWRKAGVAPEEHRDQMMLELICYRRKWCDFVAYDPRVKDHRLRLFIVRYTPTPEDIAALEADARKFLNEIEDLFLAVTHT